MLSFSNLCGGVLMDAKISVIIPCYNSSSTLEKCIESVLSQSLTEIEVIVVDDGSLDMSLSVCKNYASIDSRLKVVHQSNQGVSVARNNGMKIAKGNYIFFLDSDDYLDSNLLFRMYSVANQNNLDLVETDMTIERSDAPVFYSDEEYNIQLALKEIDLPFVFAHMEIGYSCGKLFNTELIYRYNIQFDEQMTYGEDIYFVLNFMTKLRACCKLGLRGYHYVQFNRDSLSRRYVDNISYINEKIGFSFKEVFKKFPEYEIIYYNSHMGICLNGIITYINNFYRAKSTIKRKERYFLLREYIGNDAVKNCIYNISKIQRPKRLVDRIYYLAIKSRVILIIDCVFILKEFFKQKRYMGGW